MPNRLSEDDLVNNRNIGLVSRLRFGVQNFTLDGGRLQGRLNVWVDWKAIVYALLKEIQ